MRRRSVEFTCLIKMSHNYLPILGTLHAFDNSFFFFFSSRYCLILSFDIIGSNADNAIRSIPRCNPISCNLALISFSDFLPKLLNSNILLSGIETNSAMFQYLHHVKQLVERTESSISSMPSESLSIISS